LFLLLIVTVVGGCIVVDLDRDILFCVGFSVAGEELCVCGGGLGERGWRWCGANSLEDEDEWEDGTKKFGAAATFKIPDEVDIAHLS